MYILVNVLLHSREFRCIRYVSRYALSSTKSHGFSSQDAAGFKHTVIETARMNKDKGLFITGLNSQITDGLRQSVGRVLNTLRSSYLSHMISSY